MILGAFMVNHPGGGIYISDDGGKHWAKQAEMSGQSVRSLARSRVRSEHCSSPARSRVCTAARTTESTGS